MKELLAKIREYALTEFVPIIEDDALNVLLNSVSDVKPKAILEIGTAIGYSGIAMLSVAPNDCSLTTVDIDTDRLTLAERNFKEARVSDRVKIIEEDANYLITLLDQKFDFIFLDGPKGHYQTMFPYLLNLLSDKGMIFVDDVGYHGWVDDGKYPKHKHRTIITNMRAFLKSIEENKSIISKRVDVGQGILIVKKCINLNC